VDRKADIWLGLYLHFWAKSCSIPQEQKSIQPTGQDETATGALSGRRTKRELRKLGMILRISAKFGPKARIQAQGNLQKLFF